MRRLQFLSHPKFCSTSPGSAKSGHDPQSTFGQTVERRIRPCPMITGPRSHLTPDPKKPVLAEASLVHDGGQHDFQCTVHMPKLSKFFILYDEFFSPHHACHSKHLLHAPNATSRTGAWPFQSSIPDSIPHALTGCMKCASDAHIRRI